MHRTFLKRSLTFMLALLWFGIGTVSAEKSTSSSQATENTTMSAEFTTEKTYAGYLEQYADASRPDAKIELDMMTAEGTGLEVRSVQDGENKINALYTGESSTANWSFTVDTAGLYQIHLRYHTQETKGAWIERLLHINGALPYKEMSGLSFSRVWEDAPDTYTIKENGNKVFCTDVQENDKTPLQVERPCWVDTWVYDPSGYVSEPLFVYLDSGENVLTLTALREPMLIGSIVLCQAPDIKEYSNPTGDDYGPDGFILTMQAESAVRKSDPMLYPETDRSSAATQPADPWKTRLNTIGGSNWANNGQWLEWDVTIPQAGYYKLAFKFRQNAVSGMVCTRKLTVNGQSPFKQAQSLEFAYSKDWQWKTAGEDAWIYLQEGKNTLRLECALGNSAPLLQRAGELVTRLNTIYRRVMMYVGASPDPYRNYALNRVMPDVLEEIHNVYGAAQEFSNDLQEYSKGRGAANAAVDSLLSCLEKLDEDYQKITRMLPNLKDATVALGAWVTTYSCQPLELDCFCVYTTGITLPSANEGFFEGIAFSFSTLLASYFSDYSFTEETEGRSIEVWATTGRDQAQILKMLADSYFTPNTGIKVNFKLVAGQLLMATLSGTGPDAALMLTGVEPMNYATRNALYPLDQFDGFSDLRNEFYPSAFAPFELGTHVYALPETQSFPVLFYRQDILDKLGITLPQTWDELYVIIGELQKNRLEFGMPANLTGFGMLLYQHGGSFYNADGSATALKNREATDSFKQWTQLYTSYGIPVEYDAANRFRSGEMPLLIADYTLYNQLSVFAPEIRGAWGFTVVPGVQSETSGIDTESINRSVVSNVTGCVMLRACKNPEDTWEFLKWWAGQETQTLFGRNIESVIGAAARYPTANRLAMEQLPWKTADYHTLISQWNSVVSVPEVPGGYFLSRHITNAFRRTVNIGGDEREILSEYATTVDSEIRYKRKELGLTIIEK